MVHARFLTVARVVIPDGAKVEVEVNFQDGKESVSFTTDSAGVVSATSHLDDDLATAMTLAISQPLPDRLRIDVLFDETEEGEYDALVKYLRVIFHVEGAVL